MSASTIENLPDRMIPLFGRSEDAPELRALLADIGSWPYPPFKSDGYSTGFTDKARGFDLTLNAAEVVVHPFAAGTPHRKAVLTSANFFAEGVRDKSQFQGTLPSGMTWEDTVETVAAKLGTPFATFHHKTTQTVKTYAWSVKQGIEMRTVFAMDGKLQQVQLGLDTTGVKT